MRADRPTLMLSSLRGIREVSPKLDDRIDEIHGMTDYHAGALKRVNGKLLNTTGGSIWSIRHLRFRGRAALVTRNSCHMIWAGDDAPLPGMIFPYPDYPDHGGTYGHSVSAEWPEEPELPQNNPLNPEDPGSPGGGPRGGGTRTDPRNPPSLTPIPTLVEFDTNLHANGATQIVRVKKSDSSGDLGVAVRADWASGVEWLTVSYLGPSPVQSVGNGGLFPLGAWSSIDENDILLRVAIHPGNLGGTAGTYVKTVKLSAVYWDGSIPGDGSASCVFGVKLIAREPEIDMLTDDPVWNQAVKDAL